jgi:hypothetical protein
MSARREVSEPGAPVWRWLMGAGLMLVALAGLAFLPLILAPAPSPADLARVTDPAKRIELQSANTKMQNDIRVTGLQAVGGAVLVIGAVATWRQLKIGRQQLAVSQEGQITERFTRSVAQLGEKSVDVRTGGIYALARVAKDSPPDRQAVADILTAFVKVHSPWQPTSAGDSESATSKGTEQLVPLRDRSPDVQAAMTVLGRMLPFGRIDHPGSSPVQHRLGLGNTDLRFADLRGLNLSGAWLAGANLTRAEFEGADLRGASLWLATCTSALFMGADLRRADLNGADLRNAWMQRSKLGGALTDEYTDMSGALTDDVSYEE